MAHIYGQKPSAHKPHYHESRKQRFCFTTPSTQVSRYSYISKKGHGLSKTLFFLLFYLTVIPAQGASYENPRVQPQHEEGHHQRHTDCGRHDALMSPGFWIFQVWYHSRRRSHCWYVPVHDLFVLKIFKDFFGMKDGEKKKIKV